MNKPLLAITGAAGIAALAVPTTLLTSNSSLSKRLKWNLISRFDSVTDIKNNEYEKIDCLKQTQGGIDFKTSNSASSKLPNSVQKFNASSSSCLVFEYYKQKYAEDKWWGEFRLIWILKDITSSQGLMTIVNVKTESGKLKGEAIAYFMNQDSSKNPPWLIKNKKLVNITESEDDIKSIPKASSNFETEYKDYWGFKETISKACSENECSKPSGDLIHKYVTGTFATNNTGSSVKNWSSDLYKWFKDSLSWSHIENKMEDVKGNWSLKK